VTCRGAAAGGAALAVDGDFPSPVRPGRAALSESSLLFHWLEHPTHGSPCRSRLRTGSLLEQKDRPTPLIHTPAGRVATPADTESLHCHPFRKNRVDSPWRRPPGRLTRGRGAGRPRTDYRTAARN